MRGHRRSIIVIVTLLTIVQACSSLKEMSVTSTVWHYTDSDGDDYRLIFREDGTFYRQGMENHDNDELWTRDNQRFEYSWNDRYSVYRGTFVSDSVIVGTAENVQGKTWKWELRRTDESFDEH